MAKRPGGVEALRQWTKLWRRCRVTPACTALWTGAVVAPLEDGSDARAFSGLKLRPIGLIEKLVQFAETVSIDECIATVAAFGERGVEHLPNTHSHVLYMALSTLGKCTKAPGCDAKIRGVASARAFAQDNSLDFVAGIGYTTGGPRPLSSAPSGAAKRPARSSRSRKCTSTPRAATRRTLLGRAGTGLSATRASCATVTR